jgi:hypothetical protein
MRSFSGRRALLNEHNSLNLGKIEVLLGRGRSGPLVFHAIP